MLVTTYVNLGKGKYRASFENGMTCVLYRGEAARLSLSEGCDITEEQYDILINEIIGKRAKKRAMHLLEKMDRTEHQLRDKLSKNEYPKECIDIAVEYVKSYNYIDDDRYAHNFVRLSQERLSRQQIFQKLMQRGIRKDLINSALDDEYESDEDEMIRKLLEKRHFKGQLSEDKEFQRIYNYILRRGYSSNKILKEMRNYTC